jgi:hypothetical protein
MISGLPTPNGLALVVWPKAFEVFWQNKYSAVGSGGLLLYACLGHDLPDTGFLAPSPRPQPHRTASYLCLKEKQQGAVGRFES